MKRAIGLFIIIILIVGAYSAWNVFGPTVNAPADKYFYIKTGSSYADVQRDLKEQEILSGSFFFDIVAGQLKYKNKIKPGRYKRKIQTTR